MKREELRTWLEREGMAFVALLSEHYKKPMVVKAIGFRRAIVADADEDTGEIRICEQREISVPFVGRHKEAIKYSPEQWVFLLCHEAAHIIAGSERSPDGLLVAQQHHGKAFRAQFIELVDFAQELGLWRTGVYWQAAQEVARERGDVAGKYERVLRSEQARQRAASQRKESEL